MRLGRSFFVNRPAFLPASLRTQVQFGNIPPFHDEPLKVPRKQAQEELAPQLAAKPWECWEGPGPKAPAAGRGALAEPKVTYVDA